MDNITLDIAGGWNYHVLTLVPNLVELNLTAGMMEEGEALPVIDGLKKMTVFAHASEVIELHDKRWCALEIKLGANQIDEAAHHLIRLRDEMAKEDKAVPPSILCVVCGLSNAAYVREDGVYVVPLTALRE